MNTQQSKTDPVYYQDATRLAELIRNREISPVEVVKAHLDRIEAVNAKVNAIVTISDTALNAARAAEAAVLRGDALGPLHGVPFTAKDSIDTAKLLTQRGSPIFKGRTPDTDATTVARLKNAGGILIGKTNLPEFSYWIESNNLLSGRTNNPWDLQLSPGGSSGGESAAVAAGMSPLGLGTDLAISVRGHAALTGIVALKATHGSIPMTGIWPRAPRRFWHVGPMARTIRDLQLAYSVLAGPDGQDGFSSSTLHVDAGIGNITNKKLRIGWLVEPGLGPIDPEIGIAVAAAADALKQLGHSVEQVRIPVLEEEFALDYYVKLHMMEMKPAMRAAIAGQPDELVFKYVNAVLAYAETTFEDYIAAEQSAERLRDGFAAYFQQYDALITPVLPVISHGHDIETIEPKGQKESIFLLQSATVPLNITGLPGVSVRFGTSKTGLPINVQVVGSWLAESTILHIASQLEATSTDTVLYPSI
ncbi:amidase [Chitinophaga agrisoli]|uniref:Amidase n=1 Tax=Chitinophaga agrisoli TaxID=2607653 RepID=A0A5B2VWE3_9BACT|nr:amidase [Chitinophaga agrisoli]KAA2242632.1 amidase [Chitinophaga agrisoli]